MNENENENKELTQESAEDAVPPASQESAEENAPLPEEGAKEQGELAEAMALAEDYKRKWYSVTAEYENYRRRTQNQSAQRYTEGRTDVISKLFPIADNLARAVASCKEEQTKRGIELVVKAFEKILEEEKIEEICPLGEAFDAGTCEAIMAVEPAEGEESGVVKEVYRKGYALQGKVLRYAQVVVTK